MSFLKTQVNGRQQQIQVARQHLLATLNKMLGRAMTHKEEEA